MFVRAAIAALALASCATSSPQVLSPETGQEAFLQACKTWDDWGKPAPPFRIYGNSFYVGTCGLSAILITGDDGHILIDGASRDGGPLIEANIEKLGFKVADVKILLFSHEHFDHVGGLAYLQRLSGAEMIGSAGAIKALQTGETQPDDPQFGMHDPFEPLEVARIIGRGEPVSYGKITLMPLETPGHTPGALTWSWWSCEGTDCKVIVYADSLSPVSAEEYRFSDNPDLLAKYRAGLAALASLPCHLLITPHPSSSQMIKRMASTGLQSGMDCRAYSQSIETRLNQRLEQEATGG